MQIQHGRSGCKYYIEIINIFKYTLSNKDTFTLTRTQSFYKATLILMHALHIIYKFFIILSAIYNYMVIVLRFCTQGFGNDCNNESNTLRSRIICKSKFL